jgi:hypothetical protein
MIAGAYTNALREERPAEGCQGVRHEMAMAV